MCAVLTVVLGSNARGEEDKKDKPIFPFYYAAVSHVLKHD